MKQTSQATQDIWTSGDYVGANRPMMRATIQRLNMRLLTYDLAKVQNSHRKGTGKFASAIFGQPHKPVELPNLKSIRWSRSVDQDVASCTLVLYNTAPLPLGEFPDPDTLDQPGYYTATRGQADNRWDDAPNGWRNLIVPDRLIRTYEGYGHDPEVPPELDPAMYPSGVWLIDTVSYSANGLITVECRDLGRLLLDHIVFPPVIPFPQYPLWFDRFHPETISRTVKAEGSTGWRRPKYRTDSNVPYIGSGITDGGLAYVQPNGAVYGHHGRDAFDGSTSTYWLSVGNRPKWSSAYEYIEGSVTGSVGAVRVHAWGGPYRMYISVYANGAWQGASEIPYVARVVDTDADIKYVGKAVTIDKNEDLTVVLPKAYSNATRVRVTFSRLFNSGLGHNYRYRAGVRDLEVATTGAGQTTTTNVTVTRGNYNDFTDVIKWFCAWGGFYWPMANSTMAYLTRSDGERITVAPAATDGNGPGEAGFPSGRVWGDFELTGTAGQEDLGVPLFDKKPLMDGINYVKEIVGYNFVIDESGAVIWRSPNVFNPGNWLWGLGVEGDGRTTDTIDIDERTTLLDLTPAMSSRNVREKVFVGNIQGKHAAMSAGYNPYPAKMRRIGGWTDQHFENTTECQVMADMITLRQAFRYHTATCTIAGNPAIQIDDQVRIYERTSAEQNLHYVIAITSEWDVETGKWTYQMQTHRLVDPNARWIVDKIALSAEAKAYLNNMSSQPGLS